jgi:hypothetical protein
MRAPIPLRFALAAVLLAVNGAYAGTAEVNFVNPEKFTDAGKRRQYVDSDTVLAGLREFLVKQAAQLLPADQKLVINVSDVDLAGQYDPRQLASREVRIVKETYPPRIDLYFRLVTADGTVLKEGQRNLRDPGFLTSPSLGFDNDYLRYEKSMLQEWMLREFVKDKR